MDIEASESNPRRTPGAGRQQGVAALLVVMLLGLATLLVIAFTHRSLAAEQQASADQYRSAQAFAAAEAGLEWTLAQLNRGDPIGDDCLPSAAAGAASFRHRLLGEDPAGHAFLPKTWDDAGTLRVLQTACTRTTVGWRCDCPTGRGTSLAAAASDTASTASTAFSVELVAGPSPGSIRVLSTGCTRPDGGVCAAVADASHEAAVRIEATLGLVPGLRAAPLAALTVAGRIDAGASALGARHDDAAGGGLAVHAGGAIAADNLQVVAPAGSPSSDRIAGQDAALAALGPTRFFARHFGMTQAAWAAQPATTRVACRGDCTSTLAAAVANGAALLFVDGDAALAGPLVLGTAAAPVVLVASGDLFFRGAIGVHGVVAARNLDWRDDAGAGAEIHGAAMLAGDYAGDVAATFIHDAPVLARLQFASGSFVRVNGSWKDF